MTYILGLRCTEGLVVASDFQESIEDLKRYVSKLEIVAFGSYELVLGGAGDGRAITAFIQHLKDNRHRCASFRSARKLLSKTLDAFLRRRAKRQRRKRPATVVFLAAIRHRKGKDPPQLWKVRAGEVTEVSSSAAIGIDEPLYDYLTARYFRPNRPLGQAVLAAILVTAMAKETSVSVGGPTRVAVVVPNAVCFEDLDYTRALEEQLSKLVNTTDSLLVDCGYLGISNSAFQALLQKFCEEAGALRTKHLDDTARLMLKQTTDPGFHGDCYPKVFLGALIVQGRGSISVREESDKEKQRNWALLEAAKRNSENQKSGAEWSALLAGRSDFVFIGDEQVLVGK
jgi:20S proteasome alpha/beta subunit